MTDASIRLALGSLAVATLLQGTPMSAPAEKVVLQWKWAPGQVRRYEMTGSMKSGVNAAAIGAASMDSTERRVWRLEAKEVDAEGTALLEVRCESIRATLPGFGGLPTAFDSEKYEDAAKLNEPMLKPFVGILKTTFRMRMTRAGNLTPVDEPNAKAPDQSSASPMDKMMDDIATSFSSAPAIAGQLQSALSSFLPDGTVSTGATWTRTARAKRGSLAAMNLSTTYTLHGLGRLSGLDYARIAFDGESRSERKASNDSEPDASEKPKSAIEEARIRVAEMAAAGSGAGAMETEVTGEAWFDVERGQLQRSSMTSVTETAKRGAPNDAKFHMETTGAFQLLKE